MSKPELPHGYLGCQGKWQEWGLSTISHNSPEITIDTSNVEIKLKTSKPMKMTANLIACATEKEYKELVFTQTQGDVVSLVINMPDAGFFKLQIYALLASDDSKTLPNVFNYLIYSKTAPSGPVHAFPKQFAQWKEGCFLCEPFHLHDKDTAEFKVTIPGAKAVALTVDTEWFHLQQASDGFWKGQVKDLDRFRGKVQKASLNANYGPDDTKYTSLLEYNL